MSHLPVASHFFGLVAVLGILIGVFPGNARAGGTMEWCDLKWNIRDDTGGPGPNTFSARNVQVSPDGALHLRIAKSGNHWSCAEIYTVDALEYGIYTFEVMTAVDRLDQNVVFGMFNYPRPDVGPDGTNEMDIEFSRWGNASLPIGNYTVWPAVLGPASVFHTYSFTQHEPGATQRFVWKPKIVSFESFRGFNTSAENSIAKWSTPDAFAKLVSKHAMAVHINLWLFGAQGPTDGKPVEVILKRFTYKKAT